MISHCPIWINSNKQKKHGDVKKKQIITCIITAEDNGKQVEHNPGTNQKQIKTYITKQQKPD